MDDILKLQEQLAAVQARKASTMLSDRLAVDLVAKLQELNFVSQADGLIASETGKEFVTAAALQRELRILLRTKGGRVAIVEAAASMHVYLGACEKAAAALISESPDEVRQIAGDLVSTEFFDNLAREAAELLREDGQITVAALAERFNLPAAITANELAIRIGEIEGKMEQGLLYTDTYIKRLRARLRGAMRGATTPTALSSIESVLFKDQDKSARPKVSLKSMAQEMLEAGELAGILNAGTFIPEIFSKAQEDILQQFFLQNQYITEEMVQKVGISRPAAYLKRAFPDGIMLETLCISSDIYDTIASAADEAILQSGWCDSQPFIPPFLPAGDIEKMMGQYVGSKEDPVMVLHSTYIIKKSYLEEIAKSLQDWAMTKGKEVATLRKSNKMTPAVDPKASLPSPNEMDDDEAEADSKGKKKRRSKKKETKSGRSDTGSGSRDDSGVVGSEGLKIDDIARQVAALHSSVEQKLARHVAAKIQSKLMPSFVEGLNSIFSAESDERRKFQDKWGKQLVEWHGQLVLVANGVKIVEDNKDQEKIYHKHIIRSVGIKCLDRLIRLQDDSAILQDLDDLKEDSLTKNWEKIKGAIGRKGVDSVTPLKEATGSKSQTTTSEFCQLVEDAAFKIGHRLKPLDKKAERSAVFAHKKSLTEELKQEADPGTCLALFLSLLVIKEFNVVVMLPGKLFLPAINSLSQKMDESLSKRLLEFHAQVVRNLSGALEDTPGLADEAAALKEKILEYMGAKKT